MRVVVRPRDTGAGGARVSTCGIVLAAGAGTRFGGPKALARTADGTPWVARAVRTLADAGCDPVLVVLGAARDEAAALVPADAVIVDAPDWADGLSASVRAGLTAAEATAATAALVIPVDVPDLEASTCIRLLAAAAPDSTRARATAAPHSTSALAPAAPHATRALAHATYAGEPGHPALIGRDHWAAIRDTAHGDRGAGPYLRAHGATPVECGDLWHGGDVDHAPAGERPSAVTRG